MGATCGSANDSSTPNPKNRFEREGRNKNKKLTSLDDVIKFKQRKSVEVKFSPSEKKKLFERKFSVQKDDLKRIQAIQAQFNV